MDLGTLQLLSEAVWAYARGNRALALGCATQAATRIAQEEELFLD